MNFSNLSRTRGPVGLLGALLLGLYLAATVGCGGSGDSTPTEKPETPTEQTDANKDLETDKQAEAGDNGKPLVETIKKAKPSVKVVTSSSQDEEEVAPEIPTSLAIGDKAPQIYLDDFYVGDAIEKLEIGKIYVVEFWATWCPPCRASMPHMSSLQEKYGDQVTFVGVTDEGQEKVGPFLASEAQGHDGKLWTEIVKYRLARDKNDWTNKSYMKASGQGGIPSAFIVGAEGLIEWIGHPMGMDDALDQVVAGTWDRVAGAKLLAATDAFQKAGRSGDWEQALAEIEGIEDPSVNSMRFQGYASLKKFDEAQKIAAEALESDPAVEQLNGYAWTIATMFPSESRDLDLALKIAQKANTLTDENSPPVIDTLARVYYERGEIDDAVKWQEKASLYGDADSYKATLTKYMDEKDKPEIPESLTIGDPAPVFSTSHWFAGEELESEFKEGTVYVIEFWATWCPPCRDSMPHLSKLQEEYKDDVVFIGFTKEDIAKVEDFMGKAAPGQDGKTWSEVVTYRLAKDRHDWTNQSYMKASKQGGIPSAFIVGKDGHIEWIGHPMSIDKPLKQIVDGDWDRAAGIAEAERKAKLSAAMKAARPRMMEAQRSGDMDAMLAVFEEIEEELGEDADLMAGPKFSLLVQAKKYARAIEAASSMVETNPDDGKMLNGVAWAMATAIPEDQRDLDLALKIALQASAATDDGDATVIDTVARVYFEQKNFDKAIEMQSKALELGGPRYEDALKEYKAAKEDANKPDAGDEDAAAEENEDDAAAEVIEDV